MTAYQCDVCNKLFQLPEGRCTTRRKYDIVKDCHPYADTYLELCDECYEKLINFLKEEEDGSSL